jgi:hypothetical protein
MTPALLMSTVEEGPLDSGHRSREGSRAHSTNSGSGHETRAPTPNLTGKTPGDYSKPSKLKLAPLLRHLRPASPPEGLGIGPDLVDEPLATVASGERGRERPTRMIYVFHT